MAKYSFAVLDPRPAGAEANQKIFENPKGILGIEVTIPALAARCTLGNIDPQHTEGGGLIGNRLPGAAAIEVAISIFGAALVPEGATLATVRADCDSIGAMALLDLRAEGEPFPYELAERIRLVVESDRFARGGWPGPKPLPTKENPWPESKHGQPLAAIAAAVSDFKVPIEDRVAAMEKWLLTGEEPEEYRKRAEAERLEMIEALETGWIKVEAAADGRIAVVESTHRAGTSVGYSLAPVVVALNPQFRFQGGEPHRKFTIAQFEAGYMDLWKAAEELSGLESGWGGSPTILGSPQGMSSQLTLGEVVGVVTRHLK